MPTSNEKKEKNPTNKTSCSTPDVLSDVAGYVGVSFSSCSVKLFVL